ncbi:hypothetical protein M6B38_322295 [Iris pallida]|uniref:Uncharacterized protein n=1 Tax=Iris pallida TaxID=29817 RepID=A0AAX6HAI3_IRIPA|nr:hypothetical protein M6B38_322295 [Iris pallida]
MRFSTTVSLPLRRLFSRRRRDGFRRTILFVRSDSLAVLRHFDDEIRDGRTILTATRILDLGELIFDD